MKRIGRRPLLTAIAISIAAAAPVVAHDLEPEPIDCSVAAPVLVYGARTQGCALEEPGDIVTLYFNGEAGAYVRVVVSTSSSVDLDVVVRDPEGSPIGSAGCDGGVTPETPNGCAVEIDLPPLSPSVGSLYAIEVADTDDDESGALHAQIERIPPDCTSEPCDVAEWIGLERASYLDFATINSTTDMDFWMYEVAGRERIQFDLTTVVVDHMEPRLEIWGAGSDRIDEVMCDEGAPNDVICATSQVVVGAPECTEQAPCIYSVSVTEAGHDEWSGTGGFYMRLSRLPEPSRALAGWTSLLLLAALRRNAIMRSAAPPRIVD